MNIKKLEFLGRSYGRLMEFPRITIWRAGYQLAKVQRGEEPTDWRPMSSIGLGVVEIRLHDPQEYRVIYVAKFADKVFVLHAFEKKTEKTQERDLNIARLAYAEIKERERRN